MSALIKNPFLAFGFIYGLPFLIEVIFAEWTDREFHIHLGWAAISIAYCHIFRLKPPIAAISLFFIITSAIDIAYAMTFGGVFTSSSVEAMTQTNLSEASEFLSSYLDPLTATTLTLYLCFSCFLIYQLELPGLPERKRYRSLSLFFFIVLCGFIFQGLIMKQRYTKLLPGIVGAYPAYLKGSESLDQEVADRAELIKTHAGKFIAVSDKPQTYIFVVGEATTRAHMSLYGYGRETNPELSARNDLIVFSDVISNFVQTLPSLRYALTLATTTGELSWRDALSIVGASRIAGFKTWWISNQQPLRGTYSAIGAQADTTTFISNMHFGKEVGRHDGLLLPELGKALSDPFPRKVIFLHLMGSHLKYGKRYPESFNHFHQGPYFAYTEKLSTRQKAIIDSYDNSIRYNDWLINAIINRLEKASGETDIAALSYMADHGEEIFDTLDFKGHGPDNVTKNSLDIPFVVWLSGGYRQTFPEKTNHLLANRNTPYMLNYYFHFSLSMMNIHSPFHQTELSLFSGKVSDKQRMVYGNDYEKTYATGIN